MTRRAKTPIAVLSSPRRETIEVPPKKDGDSEVADELDDSKQRNLKSANLKRQANSMRSFERTQSFELPKQSGHPLKTKVLRHFHFCGRESNFESEAPITLESARAMQTEPDNQRFLSTLAKGHQ